MSEIKTHIVQRSHELFEKVKAYREHLHQYPELSYQEHQTMKFVADKLTELGVEHQTGVGGTGVVGIIKASHHTNDMEVVALRADMDALPIHEENNVPYKSKVDGVMHACGHDAHTAILLGTAEILQEIKEQLPQPVKLIFQPGEEKNPGGASLMIKDGVLQNPTVKTIYGLHVFPDLPAGMTGFKGGLYMASCDEIYITIHGKGGHGATPHQCIDPITIGAELILNLQTIISRRRDPKIPGVLTFGYFEALGATNIIPAKAVLKGTFRTMNEEWRAEALELLQQQAKAIVEGNGATLELEISKGYPYLENDETLTAQLKQKSIDLLGSDNVVDLPIRMGSEDFSYYAQEIPACFFRIGVRDEKNGIIFGAHHARFDIDPQALKIGMQMMSLAVF
ncbi:MAG TPA: M20 family metallopeptidase [Taishania sp.]|nr:M20 family metallopeptidase [Taishania sp.]